MLKISISATPTAQMFLGKAFKAEEGGAAAQKVAGAVALAGRRVVIIDHPPTAGLLPLIDGLTAAGAQVHLRDHHADSDRDGATVAAVRERLGERAVIRTRAEAPACAGLLEAGEFADAIVIADADQDGVTAALKAIGIEYPELDDDAAVLDGPMSGKTADRLSRLGFCLVRAWGALPGFGAPGRDKALAELVCAFAEYVRGNKEDGRKLDLMADEYERKVVAASVIAGRIEWLAAGISFLDVRGAHAYDQPTLTGLLDRGAKVTVLVKGDGPIAKTASAQVSLARTKAGEEAGIDLAALVPADWARGPENGVISNTPFLLHLSPQKWEEFRPILLAAVAGG
jgi:hypothetical protein